MYRLVAKRFKVHTLCVGLPTSVSARSGIRGYAKKCGDDDDGECVQINTSKCPKIQQSEGSKRFAIEVSGIDDVRRACCVKASFRENPCAQIRKSHSKSDKDKVKKAPVVFQSMWATLPKDAPAPDDVLIRHDQLFYVPRDCERPFQKTWIDCPSPQMRIKKKCLLKKIEPPPLQKRPIAARPSTARKFNNCNDTSKCEKIRLPLCRKARSPPSCLIQIPPSDCVRIQAPYPAYSECIKPPFKKLHPNECECLAKPTQCDINEALRKKEEMDN